MNIPNRIVARERATHWLAALLISGSCSVVSAQTLNWNLTIPAYPSSSVDDWRSRLVPAFITITAGKTGVSQPITIDVAADLFRNGVAGVVAQATGTIQEFTLGANSTAVVHGDEIGWQVTDVTTSSDDSRTAVRTGKLVGGVYRLCLTLKDHAGAVSFVPTATLCKIFAVTSYQAPVLFQPSNGSAVQPGERPVFHWSPVVPTPPTPVTYTLRIFEVLPGQSATTAVQTNTPIVEAAVPAGATQAVWQPDWEPPVEGQSYVWSVWSTVEGDAPIGEPNGMADPFAFTVATRETPTPATLPPIDIPVHELCYGEGTTIAIPNLPRDVYPLWTCSDDGGPYNSWAFDRSPIEANPVSTNAIRPDTAGNISGVIVRTYKATFAPATTDNPFRPGYMPPPVSSTAVIVYLPTRAGKIRLVSAHGSIGPNNTICSDGTFPVRCTVRVEGGFGAVQWWTPGFVSKSPDEREAVYDFPNAGKYPISVAIRNGPCSPATASILVTVHRPIRARIEEQDGRRDVCAHTDAVMLLRPADGAAEIPDAAVVQWQYRVDSSAQWYNAGTDLWQNTNEISPGDQRWQTVSWRALVWNAGRPCAADTTNEWTMAVAEPRIAITGAQCSDGATPMTMVAAASAGHGEPYQYQWMTGSTARTAGSTLVLDPPPRVPTEYTVIVTDKTGCQTSASITISPCSR